MSSLSRELVFLILQFLEEEKFKESVHKLEKESGFFFNMKYFEEKVQAGDWDEVEKYLSGFTKVDDNRYSMKIFFEIRKQKYLEALDRQDKAKAVDILVNDLKVFSTFNEELFKEITQLLTLSNFRENEQLSKYGDTKTARGIMLIELKKLIEANPLFRDKLAFPTLKSSRLRTLINQSLNWQHQLCKNPRANPDIKTLFTDHTCSPPNGPLAPTPVNLPVAAVAKPASYASLGTHSPFPPTAAAANANANALAGWMANASASSSVQAAVVTASSIPVPQNQVSVLKHPRTPPTPGMVTILIIVDSNLSTGGPAKGTIVDLQFIFSTAIDGKIKAWLYDTMGSRVDYDAPGHWCTTMLYSADGSRLFSCGTSKDGDSFLVEWNESEGTIKRTYAGFRKKSNGVVQFDTTQNHFLAVGEDSQIKFWDMDNVNILTSTDAEGGLPNLPRLRFSKEGNLLAVTTADNGFKILANAIGLRSLRAVENPPFEALRTPIESVALKVSASSAVSSGTPANCKVERSSPVRPSPIINGVDPTSRSMDKPRTVDDVTDKPKPWQLAEIVDSGQCRLVTMPESTDTSSKVVRLLYTNSAVGLLALGSNGVQKLWKWHRNEQNPSGKVINFTDSEVSRYLKATASAVPQHWLPSSGLLMANDVAGVNLEEAVPCIALSKNDSYVMSATGGKISLFNMMTFKVMTTFMSPPPASTFLAFHPQDNNIIAIGTEDSTIHIYNVRVDEVKSKLKGHQKRITGLAFSTSLNILVSSGADAQLCVWSIDTWEKRKSVTIHIPAGKTPTGDTRVQFNADQVRMLVVHETQLAIYDASKMERIRQWTPQDALSAPISCAVYSCNSQLVFATFCDGNIGVFDADTLRLRCYIAPSTYLSPSVLNGSQTVYPHVVAAHPLEPNQFAIGLTDGSVKVMEPSESEGKWGVSPPVDNGILNSRTTSSSTSNHTPDQLQR
ncbi:hypothetical protein CUMW_156590 [Citrus unshiu]|uniref:CTLH domain-containing protein n=1 Tax=Citrus unshiu TaxID=55188 RepID=A0A2H5PPX9_CITUN|nr:hypothetical protein CUMW_156590 [Citrus unshiu]